MCNIIFRLLVFLSVFILSVDSFALDAGPVKYLTSCEINLAGNASDDLVLLIETKRGREFIILIRNGDSFGPIYTEKVSEFHQISCTHSPQVYGYNENGERKEIKTSGAFVKLYQPEGSAEAIFFQDNKINRAWISK